MLDALRGFYVAYWPAVLGGLLVAVSGPLLFQRRGVPGLLIAIMSSWAIAALIHWTRVSLFLARHPQSRMPGLVVLLSVAWYLVWLGLTAAVVFGAARLGGSHLLQIGMAALAATILPPLISLVLLFVGCYGFGKCP